MLPSFFFGALVVLHAAAGSITPINPSGLLPMPGYSQVVVSTRAKRVYLAGQVAVDQNGRTVGGKSLRKQVVFALKNVATALAAGGAKFSDVVRVTIYVKGLNDKTKEELRAGLTEGYAALGVSPPAGAASTLIGVQALARPELLVEIEMQAEID